MSSLPVARPPIVDELPDGAGRHTTVRFYEEYAQAYFERTVGLDLSALYEPFLACIHEGGRILDLGCGSGRDSKVFLERGYQVTPVEASERLANLASDYLGEPVLLSTAEWLPNLIMLPYDGIWACASLLHVEPTMFPSTLRALVRLIKPGGCLYASLKQIGPGKRVHGFEVSTDNAGPVVRRFIHVSETYLQDIFESDPKVAGCRTWVTPDTGDRPTDWVNALVIRGD